MLSIRLVPASTLCFLLVACSKDKGSEDTAGTGTTPASMTELSLSYSDYVPSVVYASWEAPVPTSGAIVATNAAGETWSTPVSEMADAHTVTVLELPVGESYELVLQGEDAEGAPWASEPVVFDSPSLPASIPLLELTTSDPDRSVGFHLTPLVLDTPVEDLHQILIIDDQGRIVWDGINPEGVSPISARFSRDGTRVLTNSELGIYSHPLDGTAPTLYPGTGAHHDFAELPDGHIATISSETREVDGEQLLGDTVLELDGEGNQEVIWNIWDHLEELNLMDGHGVDWDSQDIAHANALTYDDATDELVIGLPGAVSVLRFKRESGETTWMVGPEAVGQIVMPGLEDWRLHHKIALTDDGYFIFVNNRLSDNCSTVWRVTVDAENGTAEMSDEMGKEECYTTFALGDVHMISEERMQVIWTTSGVIEERNLAGDVLWSLHNDFGSGLGYGDFRTSLYP